MEILYLPLICVAVLVLHLIWNAFSSDLSWLPGPPLAKYSSLWRLWQAYLAKDSFGLKDIHQKYGKVVLIAPNIVSLADPSLIDRVLGARSHLYKSDQAKAFQVMLNGKIVPRMSSIVDSKGHDDLRRPVANVYSLSYVIGFEHQVDVIIGLLLRKLDEKYIQGQNRDRACDINNWLQYFAFDVITYLMLSRSFGMLDNGADIDGMLDSIEEEFQYRGFVMQMPSLDNWLKKNPILRLFYQPVYKYVVHSKTLLDGKLARISEKKGDTEKKDMLDRLFEMQKTKPEVNDTVIMSQVSSNILAGSDTTAVVLRTIIYYSLKEDRRVFRRLQQELDEADLQYPVSYKDSQKLTYLAAVISEALRVQPVTNVLLERVLPPEGLELSDGRRLPGGTVVGFSPWGTQFDQEVFGEDVEHFRPERWLPMPEETTERHEERVKHMKRSDLAFSYGPRNCLGKQIALMEIYKLVPTLVGMFDMELVDPKKEWKVRNTFLRRQYDMDIRLKWRNETSLATLQLGT